MQDRKIRPNRHRAAGSKSPRLGRRPVIVLEESAQSLLAFNVSSMERLQWSLPGKQQPVFFTLVVSLGVKMLNEIVEGALQRTFSKQNEL